MNAPFTQQQAAMDKEVKIGPRGQGTPGHWGKWKGKNCAAEGCELPAKSRGFCNSHYNKDKWARGHKAPSYLDETKRRDAKLKHRYGITLEDYERRLIEQDGKCAICKQPPGKNVRAHWGGKLCVDHCHDTGKVRGLLCNDCNLAVGYGKTEQVLLSAAQYIRDNS